MSTTSDTSRTYLVCATPRSGSTLLCAMLAATGVAGSPEEFFEARRESGIPRRPREYFEAAAGLTLSCVPDLDPPTPAYSDLREVTHWRDHLAASRRIGTTPNGVFGAKLMWMHLDDLTWLARRLPELADADVAGVLDTLFPDATYVWVRRDDKVRQAISLWKAMHTQTWRHADERPEAPPRYDSVALRHLVRLLERHDAAWAAHFAARGIAPLQLTYETIAADPPAAASTVLRALGLPDAIPADASPPLRRQADEESDDWARRLRADAADRPTGALA